MHPAVIARMETGNHKFILHTSTSNTAATISASLELSSTQINQVLKVVKIEDVPSNYSIRLDVKKRTEIKFDLGQLKLEIGGTKHRSIQLILFSTIHTTTALKS
ncbi:hypothetical protein SETIT_7G048900v2 [Setaria italica]|uniref:Uncharacterized protein n=1 Tax=Setaria italica TaxID=4555 RepID=A0A368RRZ8_SETIT|nr:hypothetical protein SETIT_7G048900v2 [Setaria italica]